MKLLVDMNLSPEWVRVLEEGGWEATHWSKIGDAGASDSEIMTWAKANGHVVFTHDLDFGAILAATKAQSPSVLQIRTKDVNPHHIRNLVISVLNQFKVQLEKGALVSVDESTSRARILPFNE
jgi:predicted nuclease of predicted toxin-antitoxin system